MIACQVSQSMNASLFIVEAGSDNAKVLRVSTIVIAIDRVGTEISQLKEPCVSGGNKERNVGNSVNWPPSGAASPESPAKYFQPFLIGRLRHNYQASLFFCRGAIVPPQEQVEPAR